jgi:polyhydroxyalkanoate synthase
MPDTRVDHRRHTARKALHAEPPGIVRTAPIEAPNRYSTKSLDRAFNALLARFTLDIAPSGSPGKEIQLMEKAARDVGGGQCGHLDADPRIGPRHQARRDRGQASLEAHVR